MDSRTILAVTQNPLKDRKTILHLGCDYSNVTKSILKVDSGNQIISISKLANYGILCQILF